MIATLEQQSPLYYSDLFMCKTMYRARYKESYVPDSYDMNPYWLERATSTSAISTISTGSVDAIWLVMAWKADSWA